MSHVPFKRTLFESTAILCLRSGNWQNPYYSFGYNEHFRYFHVITQAIRASRPSARIEKVDSILILSSHINLRSRSRSQKLRSERSPAISDRLRPAQSIVRTFQTWSLRMSKKISKAEWPGMGLTGWLVAMAVASWRWHKGAKLYLPPLHCGWPGLKVHICLQ